MTRIPLGSWKFFPDKASLRHCVLIITLGQEANKDYKRDVFSIF